MYAVIFKAEILRFDEEYQRMALQLRKLAESDYGCREFIALSEDGKEIAISYWDSLEQIQAWKKDPLHIEAQKKGREKWYKQYEVQIVEIVREYQNL